MIQNRFRLCAALRLIAAVLAFMVMSCGVAAFAADVEGDVFGARVPDAQPEDFAGAWSLRWLVSDVPVDIQTYGYFDIYPQGHVDVSAGSAEEEAYYSTEIRDAGNGFMYVADENGEYAYYLFLTEEGMLGCVKTLENPETILYLEYNGELYDEYLEEEALTGAILDYMGELREDMPAEAFQGRWCAFEFTNDAGGLTPMYMMGAEMDIVVEGDTAKVTYRVGEDEESYESRVYYELAYAEIMDEYEEESRFMILLNDGRMALTDNQVLPGEAIFLLPEDRWEAQMAEVSYDPEARPGERLDIADFSDAAGEWTSTHFNYGGLIYPVMSMGTPMEISICEDGEIVIGSDGEFTCAEGVIEDGCLRITDDDGYESYLFLHEGGFLVESAYIDDFSMVTYYQCLD